MQSDPRSPAPGTATTDDPSGRRTRARRWLLSYGLRVETLLAVAIVAAAFVTGLVVVLGALTALPTGPPPEGGESGTSGSDGMLAFGTLLINGCLLLAIGLGVFLLVHAAVEAWTAVRTGSGLDGGMALAYAAARTVQTVAAAAFVGPVLVGVALSRLGVVGDEPSTALIVALLGSGLLMLASVITHAVGRAGRSLVEA